MADRLFDLVLGNDRQIARPRICGETCTERLQIRVVFRTEVVLRWAKRRRKSCVGNRIVECEKSGSQANTPEYDCAGDRMDSVSQRNHAGDTCDD